MLGTEVLRATSKNAPQARIPLTAMATRVDVIALAAEFVITLPDYARVFPVSLELDANTRYDRPPTLFSLPPPALSLTFSLTFF